MPWPAKTDTALYKAALPNRYASLARPFGVVGAIVIEASPLASDNDWVLRQAAGHPIIVGMVGDLIPGTPSYAKDLDRLHRNPLFLGIRYGNLWDRDLAVDAQKADPRGSTASVAWCREMLISRNTNVLSAERPSRVPRRPRGASRRGSRR